MKVEDSRLRRVIMRNLISTAVYSIFIIGLCPVVSSAIEIATEAENWESQAVQSLTYKGKPLTLRDNGGFRETRKKPLCVRLNNYGCVKQGYDPWNGSGGRRDTKGHAVFNDPSFSIRAIVRDYCSKHKRGIRTAVELASVYSPWCDTLGSLPVYKGWGRSCSDSPKPPSGFSGPLCKEPKGEPTEAQCRSCNCPDQLATMWLYGFDRDGNAPSPYTDLKLFDANGKPDEASFSTLLINKIRIETGGFEPIDSVLKRGISLAGVCR